ncbi:endonuclease domain-containing 1 protein-like [Motacilla alba alba]|uniref:endonuclease domain-containing 1 protein-like n=1 Tax=Motacilla alba alba TaxID=1094192 RepID=UPI0018D52A6D|nr:endonuclease domain-containing 1 protein-like [Motacilla alba alba]
MLGLLLLQVLASCLWLGHSEVVKSFATCPQFFYAGTPPNDVLKPNNPAWICQRFRNLHRYATLYDRDRRIPVYSAYKYKPGSGKTTDMPWFVEPQLIGKNNLKEMERESVLMDQHKFTSDQIKESQAVPADYKGLKGLDLGHLNPTGHQDGVENKTATFSLTNIVPQDKSLKKGQWSVYESKTMSKISQGCNTTYVITGAVPGNINIAEGRINRPSHIWSATCCLVGKKTMKAWGAIAENSKNKVENLSLGELEERLTKLYGGKKKVSLFNKACPRQ